ncbi:MAG TPA: substrate-binding domain-containing protein [Pyrinomonadaceae bacterium]|jgi:D-xylose transport system substrate-binding protein|nr:substrate-binding domain-containing protein [Pyrinomonadaceae bacterium]
MREAKGLAFVLAAASALAWAAACGPAATTQNGAGGASNANGAAPSGAGGATAGGYQKKTKKQGEKVYIGFSMDTLKEERWQRDKQLVEAKAAEVGAQLDVQVANGDDAVQTKQCDNMLTKGVDVLIVAPHNGEIAASIVEKAHAAGVPVISYDRLIKNSDVDLYVSHQVEKMGEMQGDYALKHAPKGNYVLIGGAPTDNNALLLRKGQMNILKPAVDGGAVKVISDQFAKEWKAEEAQRITEDSLTKTNKDIQAIVASNDGTAGGAVSALKAAGIPDGKVIVTGQDAQLDAVQRIAAGSQTMTIYKPIKPLADSAVDAAVKLAYGQPIDAPDKVNNGKIDVPSKLQEPQAVDKENLDATIIKDGYHKCEDVYKDVPSHKCATADAGGKPGAEGGGPKTFAASAFAALGLLLSAFAFVRSR